MKLSIHPAYHEKATITCSCGNVLIVGSTKETMHTEVCSNCHPFYTGKEKLIDTAGRVDRFRKMQAKKTDLSTKKTPKKERMVKKAKHCRRKRRCEKILRKNQRSSSLKV